MGFLGGGSKKSRSRGVGARSSRPSLRDDSAADGASAGAAHDGQAAAQVVARHRLQILESTALLLGHETRADHALSAIAGPPPGAFNVRYHTVQTSEGDPSQPSAARAVPRDPKASLVAQALEQGTTMAIADVKSDANLSDRLLAALNARSVLVVPIGLGEETAILGLCRREARPFNEEETARAEILAARLAALLAGLGHREEEHPADAQGEQAPGSQTDEGDPDAPAKDHGKKPYGSAGAPSEEAEEPDRWDAGNLMPYRYCQRIAIQHGPVLPRAHEFFDVDCREISSKGIVFVWEMKPNFDTVVFALGAGPEVRHLTARVIETERIETGLYLVRCRFLGRVYV